MKHLIWILLFPILTAAAGAKPAKRPAPPAILPTTQPAIPGVDEIIFAVHPVLGEHWYANFGYYAADTNIKAFRTGAKLCRLNLRTGQRTVLLDDPAGGIRDPQVHYSARKILFSYRKGNQPNFHLYEIDPDGANLRQLTDGPWDDFEPTYTADGSIVFVSSRCKRWVNCWLTQVAVLYRCDADGRNIHPLSSNNEQDNTPWPLPDGRILYTRWEYVDRSQVHYHHLWVVNPDGTSQMVYFGNQSAGTLMIDAKPIPGTDKVVACFSPGHGQTEHNGAIAIIDPKAGPDATSFARTLTTAKNFRDPWAFSESSIMAATGHSIVLINAQGAVCAIYQLPPDEIKAAFQIHDPRPLIPRTPERTIAPRIDPAKPTARLFLADVNTGRNMTGIKPGEIKKLLVLETLPKPINYTGGMEPLSYGGTFTLERILGTVPVEPDGSACFDIPALRSVFFVALDENDLAVKRMQSFVTLQPGETTGCVGCHEQRVVAPSVLAARRPQALRRAPSSIQPIADVPDILDFPRDIQPILDRHCVSCHNYTKRDAGIILTGDRGPMFSHSYFMLTVLRQFIDGRNAPRSNYAPRTLGSSVSPLLAKLSGSHYGIKAPDIDRRIVRLWIDSGAPYPGTYAGLGTGMIGGYYENQQKLENDQAWPETRAAAQTFARRCASCHNPTAKPLPRSLCDEIGFSFWMPNIADPRILYNRHSVFNLTRPAQSLYLLGPLARNAGGYGTCRPLAKTTTAPAQPVFASTDDPDYKALLAMIQAGQRRLDQIKRFDMPGFRPHDAWVREMKRYGVLPADLPPQAPLDVYAIERLYWQSLWYHPNQ